MSERMGSDNCDWINNKDRKDKRRVGDLFLIQYPTYKDKINNTNHIRYGEFWSDKGYMTENYIKEGKRFIQCGDDTISRVVSHSELVELLPEYFI